MFPNPGRELVEALERARGEWREPPLGLAMVLAGSMIVRQRELTPLSATGFTFRVRCTLNPPFVHRKKQRTAVDEETT